MTNLTVVVGGQYGSEAKGATVACLTREFDEHDLVVRVAGPNAGHTAYDSTGREWKLRAVPVAAVSGKASLHIAAGSEIDPIVLADEVTALDEAGFDVSRRLSIHPMATVLLQRNIDEEKVQGLVNRIGSTGKGIGSARSDRILRTAPVARDFYKGARLSNDGPFSLDEWSNIVIEGTQGYGLGLHHRNYPQVTSSNCRAIDFLSMAGIPPWDDAIDVFDVIVVARCFPIRVAGNSGPLKNETSWENLGLPEERTTVTNKVRRVGEWDDELLAEAIHANGGGNWDEGVILAITMLDQRFPEVAGQTVYEELSQRARDWIEQVEENHRTSVQFVGTSPQTMIEVDR